MSDTKNQNGNNGLIRLADAGPLLPVPQNYQSLHRWVTAGLQVRGATIKLQATRVGTRWYTRAEWVADFQRAIDAANEVLA